MFTGTNWILKLCFLYKKSSCIVCIVYSLWVITSDLLCTIWWKYFMISDAFLILSVSDSVWYKTESVVRNVKIRKCISLHSAWWQFAAPSVLSRNIPDILEMTWDEFYYRPMGSVSALPHFTTEREREMTTQTSVFVLNAPGESWWHLWYDINMCNINVAFWYD